MESKIKKMYQPKKGANQLAVKRKNDAKNEAESTKRNNKKDQPQSDGESDHLEENLNSFKLGQKIKFFNKFKNEVDTCTFLGKINNRFKCSLKHGKIIYLEAKYICVE